MDFYCMLVAIVYAFAYGVVDITMQMNQAKLVKPCHTSSFVSLFIPTSGLLLS